MKDLAINHPAEIVAQQPAGRGLRLRAFRLAQGENLEDVYAANTDISFIDDVVDPEFQRLMRLYKEPMQHHPRAPRLNRRLAAA